MGAAEELLVIVTCPRDYYLLVVEIRAFATGNASATWLLEGNDGNGVQTVTLTGTSVTAPQLPPPSPPPSSPPTPPPTTPSATLTISTLAGHVGTFPTLNTSGDASGGSVGCGVINGTATGCAIVGDNLSAKSAGTCVVTATKSASGFIQWRIPRRRIRAFMEFDVMLNGCGVLFQI